MTINDFNRLMFWSVQIRRAIAGSMIQSMKFSQSYKQELQYLYDTLKALPHKDNLYTFTQNGEEIGFDLSYELQELEKDITFLNHVPDSFLYYVYQMNRNNIKDEVKQGMTFLRDLNFNSFITDRDGTVNNYCGRYLSSVQSVYNAYFLSGFALLKCRNSVILTSAPLENIGLLDVSVNPPMIFHYAGSKGREYMDIHGRQGSLPIEEDKQQKLDELNKQIAVLVEKPPYRIASFIGSGLQCKYGQTTLARQDIYHTVPDALSQALLGEIRSIVKNLDPAEEYFRIEDTGKDIEIILTIGNGDTAAVKDFDKGDGIKYLHEALGLGLEKGPHLVCGDTASDLSMVEAVRGFSEDVYTVFVTEDTELQRKVSSLCKRSYFVSCPDSLILLLHQLTRKG
ncbi:MAG: trehalose 6-phosphate synthase [Spirochaetia bacterium]